MAILNYALTLEYLQAAFYTEAERSEALQGRPRSARPGSSAPSSARTSRRSRTCSGQQAAKKPTFNFQGTTEDHDAFLKTAVAFEDLAVAAYKGQAPRLKANAALAAAARDPLGRSSPRGLDALPVGVQPGQGRVRRAQVRSSRSTQLVESTNFVTAAPSMKSKRDPRFTG